MPAKKEDANLYLNTEMAFTFIKEHETVEKKYSEGRLDLGTATTERDVRVQLLEKACQELRKIRFFLMAIEFKEREKKLLIQLFEYGETSDKDKARTNKSVGQVSFLFTF